MSDSEEYDPDERITKPFKWVTGKLSPLLYGPLPRYAWSQTNRGQYANAFKQLDSMLASPT